MLSNNRIYHYHCYIYHIYKSFYPSLNVLDSSTIAWKHHPSDKVYCLAKLLRESPPNTEEMRRSNNPIISYEILLGYCKSFARYFFFILFPFRHSSISVLHLLLSLSQSLLIVIIRLFMENMLWISLLGCIIIPILNKI